jgi:hypothetical protein
MPALRYENCKIILERNKACYGKMQRDVRKRISDF